MTEHDDEVHATHAELTDTLRASIAAIRADVEARSDPVLSQIADALDVVTRLANHAHDHALDNRSRIEALEDAADCATPEQRPHA